MAITISGENNNDKILASDGVIDQLSGFSIVGVITATSFTGDVTGNLTGNVTGNINNSTLLLQTGSTERVRIDAAGNMSLGKGSASSTSYGRNLQIHHNGTSGAALQLTDNNTGSGGGDGFHIISTSQIAYLWQRENANMVFGTHEN